MRAHVLALIVLSAGCSSGRQEIPACDGPEPTVAQPDEHVQLHIRNVRLHATETVAFDIDEIRGELIPTRKGRPADTEDATSYEIRLERARIQVSEKSIANDFRDYVLAGTGAPIEGLEVKAKDGALHLTGRIKPGVPFAITAEISVVDGKIRVHSRKIETAGIGVRTISEKTGIGLDRIIGTHEKRGVVVDGNDMTLDVALAFPPPHLDGQLESVTVVDGAIDLRFGRSPKLSKSGSAPMPEVGAKNFIQHFGGTLASGKVVVHGADQRFLDADPSDVFDYSQPRFASHQLPASKIRVSPKGVTTTLIVPDLEDVEQQRVRGDDDTADPPRK